ncbi:MAG TPA: hypothetical protein VI795_01600 [Patescibacteria group bacterium]|nr:hypothetical protein [Patescibacteria group bacterium]
MEAGENGGLTNNINGEKSSIQKIRELIQRAGSQKQTPEQLAWIKPPEVFDSSIIRNRVYPEILRKISQRDNTKIESHGMPPYIYSVYRIAAVPADNEDPEDRTYPDIPESSKISQFIDFVAKSDVPVDTTNQLEKLLEISDGSLTDAALLGMLASRMVARNIDKTMYPDISISEETRDKWDHNLLPFDSSIKPQDKLGDNYYFWTSIYTKVASESASDNGLFYKTMDKYAAKIMGFSRRHLAKQSTITDHSEAFKQGKATANILLNSIQKNSN